MRLIKLLLITYLFICTSAFAFDIQRVAEDPYAASQEELSYLGKAHSEFIVDIDVTGNAHINSKEILSHIKTKLGDSINKIRLMVDENSIKKMGYFDSIDHEYYEVDDGYVLLFKVVENPVIEKIEFIGSTVYSDSQLQDSITATINNILNFSEVRTDMKAIEALYHDDGYAFMKVLKVETPASRTDNAVVFTIQEGRVGNIGVEGNNFTKDRVILRELAMKKGDVFNYENLMLDGRSVFNLNFFKDVRPRFVPGEEKDVVDIIWNIEEKKTNTINLGGSYGSLYGLSFFVDLHMDNFNGNGELVSIKGEWGKELTSYKFKYHNPWIMEPKTSMTFRLWNTESSVDESAEGDAKRIGGDLSFSRKLDQFWSITGKVKLENVYPNDNAASNYRLFTLGGSVAYDTRDNWMNPTKGDYYSLSLENSNRLFGGTVDQTKFFINASKFYPLADKQTLAFRLSWAEGYGTINDIERFYIGGGTTVRGFPDGSPFARGSRRLLASAEYRLTFTDAFQGVLFYDLGKMGAVDSNTVNFEGDSSWRSGWGFGFRINSPLGPIRIDFGWTDPKGFNNGENSSVHFNIGQAF